jgi:hypothetical protein
VASFFLSQKRISSFLIELLCPWPVIRELVVVPDRITKNSGYSTPSMPIKGYQEEKSFAVICISSPVGTEKTHFVRSLFQNGPRVSVVTAHKLFGNVCRK